MVASATGAGATGAGTGAGAAAGYGPLHIGTDIGGSIRLPAGWCGVFGLNPSNGRIPNKREFDFDLKGFMARPLTTI